LLVSFFYLLEVFLGLCFGVIKKRVKPVDYSNSSYDIRDYSCFGRLITKPQQMQSSAYDPSLAH
jgi:hypothetical protein